MKVLVIGDVHIKKDNMIEIDMFIEKIVAFAANTIPDIIVILGDILHTHERILTPCMNKACELFEKMKNIAFTYVLVGNHDYESNQVFLEDKHWMNAIKSWDNIRIIDKPEIISIDSYNFVMTPYVYPGRFLEALNQEISFETIDHTKITCIFAHQEFYGCKMGAIISKDGDKWSEEYPLIVSGHIHSKDWLQKNIYYTGSALQHAFGESDINTISLFDFLEDNTYEHIEINLELPRKKIIYSKIEDINDICIPKTEDKIRLTISGNYQEFKTFKNTEKYKELKNYIKIEYKPNKLDKIPNIKVKKCIHFLELLYNDISNDDNMIEIYNNITK